MLISRSSYALFIFQVALRLIKCACGVNIADQNKRIPLHVAASYGHRLLIKNLVYAGSHLNWQDARRRTPLYLAVVGRHSGVVEDLIQYGCDMNLCTSSNISPLTLAAQKGHEECVRVLLDKGARCMNSRRSQGAVPLESALLRVVTRGSKKLQNYLNIVVMLLQAGGDAPCPQSFYVALGALQNENLDTEEWLNIIHVLIIAGTRPELPVRDKPTKTDEVIHQWISEYVRRALTLKDLCRRTIREYLQHCHGNVIFAVKKLSVPNHYKDIILLKDVCMVKE